MVDFSRTRRRDDDAPASRRRDDDAPRSRRDDDRGSDRRASSRDDTPTSRRRDDDTPRRGGTSRFSYQPRTVEDVKKRTEMGSGGDFDKILKPHIKMWSAKDGDNRVRILPPTWPDARHFAFDIWVNYGVGPDRDSYLSLAKMRNEDDPIAEELQRARNTAREGDKDDEQYIKDLTPKRRELVYIIDRDDEKEGVQAWAMPWTLSRDIVSISADKSTGEVLPFDDPENGYDIDFTKTGKGVNTKYAGVSIARRSSRLGKEEWLDFAIDNPLPDQLNFFTYEHIAKVFGAKGEQRERRRDDDRDRGDDRRSSRDNDRGGRDRDDGGSRRDDRSDRGRRREPEPKQDDGVTWESVHGMTYTELEDLIEQERLNIDPREAKDDEDLAAWICEEMKLTEALEPQSRRRDADDPAPRARADEGTGDKLRDLRRRREG